MVRLTVVAWVLAEIAGFALMGQAVGVLGVLALVMLAALLGGWLLRRQGGEALAAMRNSLNLGRDPRPALLRGGFGFAAALLLILPGFLSDLVGLALLVPPVQRALARRLSAKGVRVTGVRAEAFSARGPARPETPRDRIVDADWEEVAPPKQPTHRPSGWTRH